jgi:signal transduction histidine kinase
VRVRVRAVCARCALLLQPLNGMLGNLQCAKRCHSLEDVHRYVERALGAGSVLTGLLDDTLDVTRIEQGRVALEMGHVALPALADDCIDLVAPSAAKAQTVPALHSPLHLCTCLRHRVICDLTMARVLCWRVCSVSAIQLGRGQAHRATPRDRTGGLDGG